MSYQLCEGCKLADGCVHRAGRSNVVNCAEFTPEPNRFIRDTGAEKTSTGKKTADRSGLCVNCTNETVCSFPEPAGGVLDCNEYS
ncbi:MAG: hypothetical protein ACOC2T_00630 [Planctomycetota bacterium]